mmetsp:Transcript_56142/g.136005  ORF Transcript_56142/g.136005 Transcript_56142/m.136005 type:complete len:463 (+) Transcript_56142:116-1504(+)
MFVNSSISVIDRMKCRMSTSLLIFTTMMLLLFFLLPSALVVVVVSYAPHPTITTSIPTRGRRFMINNHPIKRSAAAVPSWGNCVTSVVESTTTTLYDNTSTDVVPVASADTSSTSTTTTSTNVETTGGQQSQLSPPSSPQPLSFVSEPQHVYIEDTDAYGIVLNSNYIKFYERALMVVTMMDRNNDEKRFEKNVMLMMMMVGFQQQKFRSSPKLGDEYVIRGKYNRRKGDNENNNDDCDGTWDLEMTNVDGSIVYNTLYGAILWSTDSDDSSSNDVNNVDREQLSKSPPPSVYSFTVWHDELDRMVVTDTTPPLSRYVLPLHSSLNFFERPRSNLIGGPDQLRKLQDEDGVVVVVTSIEDCYHHMPNMIGRVYYRGGDRDQNPSSLYPGQQIQVETSYDVKRNGMIVDCYQTVLSPTGGDDDDDDKLLTLTQGKVTVMMIDAKTRRPTKRLPSWLKENLGLD